MCAAASSLLASLCYSIITNNSQETIYVLYEDPVPNGPDYVAVAPGQTYPYSDHDGFMTKAQYEAGDGHSWYKTPGLDGLSPDATYEGGTNVTTQWWSWGGWTDENHSSVSECASDNQWVK